MWTEIHVNGSSQQKRFSRPLNVFIGCLSLRFSIREAVRIDHDIFFCSFNEVPRTASKDSNI